MPNANSWLRRFVREPRSLSRHRRLGGEFLEPRLNMTWGGVVPPVSINPPVNPTPVGLNLQNDATLSAGIATTEVDYFAFTPIYSGKFKISATTPISTLDTLMGVYSATGQRLAYSDNISNKNTDSQLTINLLANTKYFIGVTNLTAFTIGTYTLAIDGEVPKVKTVDLVGAGLTASPTTTGWGQSLTVQATIRNTGNTPSIPFTEKWYLSRDTLGSSDDLLLQRVANFNGTPGYTVPGLAGGLSTSISTLLKLPVALPPGWSGTQFYIVMQTDTGGNVIETNERNNFGQAGLGLDSVAITIDDTLQASSFQIDLNLSGLTTSQQTIFLQAANRWEQVITGDLPNANFVGVIVDDLLINATAFPIDGPGQILGQAAPDAFRAGSFLPYHGFMQFDSADIASMEQSGLLFSVILHEMGHVLGIGTIWTDLGLLSGFGTLTPTFTGVQATAAYNQIFATNATGVPVESGGGPGTAYSHWSEDILQSELMTGFAGPGVNLPLSAITVGSMADMGYTVNMAAADPYTAPASNLTTGINSTTTTAAIQGRKLLVADNSTLSNGAIDAIMAGLASADQSPSVRSTIRRS